MEEEAWKRKHGGGSLEEEEEEAGRGSMEEEAWRRKPGGGSKEEEASRERKHGGARGGTMGAPGHLGAEMCQNHCVLQQKRSRPTISSRRDGSKCHKVL